MEGDNRETLCVTIFLGYHVETMGSSSPKAHHLYGYFVGSIVGLEAKAGLHTKIKSSVLYRK